MDTRPGLRQTFPMHATPASAAAVLGVGFHGTTPEDAPLERLAELAPGCLVLFRRNLVSPAQTAELVRSLRETLPALALVAIDQEGGRVSRLEPFVGPTPTARALAARAPRIARAFGARTGQALAALGFNLDFAPVVDLSPADAPNGVGDRSYSEDPARAARHAGAFLRGLQSRGVAGCLKHFPGLGATDVDSHESLPAVRRRAEELRALDLEPYRRLAAEAPAVMIGHGWYPDWAGEPPRPATAVPEVIGGLLRAELGYEGLTVSDDLEMGAAAPDPDGPGSSAPEILDAGCDLLLYCSDLDRAEAARDALARRAAAEPAFRLRLESAARRIAATAREWPLPEPDAALWRRAERGLRRYARLDPVRRSKISR